MLTLGSVVIVGTGVMLISTTIDICVGAGPIIGGIACGLAIVGLGLPGVGAIAFSGHVFLGGIKIGEAYLNDIFEVKPKTEGTAP